MSDRRRAFVPDYAVPPGETLHETMVSLDLTPSLLSAKTGLLLSEVRGLLTGQTPLTRADADALAPVTGISAQFWLNLETNYRTALAHQALVTV